MRKIFLPLLLSGVIGVAVDNEQGQCKKGPTALWTGEWEIKQSVCVPTWLGKTNTDIVAGAGSCVTQAYYFLTNSERNTTISNRTLSTPEGSIIVTGTMDTSKTRAYIGGIGAIEAISLPEGTVEWNRSGVPENFTMCVAGLNWLMFRQSIAYRESPDRVTSSGYCGDKDETLLLEDIDAETGLDIVNTGFDVTYWKWTGQQRHRSAIAVVGDFVYLAAQSENAEHGWIVKLDWTSGVSSTPLWNVSLIWHRTPGDMQAIPDIISITPLHITADNVTRVFLAILVNAAVHTICDENPEQRIVTELPGGVDRQWVMKPVPSSCSTPGFNLVVAHNSETVHPLQRVFVTFLLVGFSGTTDITYHSEIDTNVDMVLREMAVDGFDPTCKAGLGVWVASVKSCTGENPSAPGCANWQQGESPVLVSFNASNINDSKCSACQQGWAGPACNKKCPCVHGGGSQGACYDGPYHNGSCRCSTRTYSASCLPCSCVEGVCDTGISGTGSCKYCTNNVSFGVNCDRVCRCKGGTQCDAGIHGSGRCVPTHSSESSSSWKSLYTFLLVGAGVLLVVTAVLVYYSFFAKSLSYVAVTAKDEDAEDSEEGNPGTRRVNVNEVDPHAE